MSSTATVAGDQISVLTDIAMATHAPVQPRARGAARLSVKPTDRGTQLATLRQSGSMKVLFPRQSAAAVQAVLINTAGGITGGDNMSVQATAKAQTHLTITTQAAERAYRAQPGETGRVVNALTIQNGARLDWLPQETILFDGCALERSLLVDLGETSRFLMVEPLVFGRDAMGETLTDARFSDRIEIRRAGQPLYLDAIRLRGDITRHLARPTVAAGAGAMACVIYIAPDAEAQTGPVRAMLPDTAGASLIGADMLVMRLLASDSFELRKSLIPILNRLTNDTLPRPWMT